ncbi:hypothetical protein BC939DRAFT_455417 [Gamsiella multidivaricata]|uniref:uncharacterized protein n=1 Tax=Gamsiella multidivaricata TaxID=101098 RepID=UPI00221E9EE2|nr:uncharacterized protein BC939DRAFT_455417 [Gamsiella multidivaricata]KAI7821513.1 hypothetical protein BC939DRAFT_455417 [Gamsiella multidivaricata]
MKDWEKAYLIHGRDEFSPLSSSDHYQMHKQEMERENITSKKVTHSGRGSGARHAQEMGAGVEEIAQHGNWNNSRVVLFYLSGIPKDVPQRRIRY